MDCLIKNDSLKIINCLDVRYKSEEQLLQNAYDSVIKNIKENNESRKQSMILAERAWIKFRDAQCSFDSSVSTPGEKAGTVQQICMIENTIERRNTLEGILKTLTGTSCQ